MTEDSKKAVLSGEKLYYTIGEASGIVGVKPFVLRYWETEFPSVRPAKTRSKRRLYRREDVERLLMIKSLLHEQKYTIDGARKQLNERETAHQLDLSLVAEEKPSKPEEKISSGLRERVVSELQDLLKVLGGEGVEERINPSRPTAASEHLVARPGDETMILPSGANIETGASVLPKAAVVPTVPPVKTPPAEIPAVENMPQQVKTNPPSTGGKCWITKNQSGSLVEKDTEEGPDSKPLDDWFK